MIAANDNIRPRTRSEAMAEWLSLSVAIIYSAASCVAVGYALFAVVTGASRPT